MHIAIFQALSIRLTKLIIFVKKSQKASESDHTQ